MRLVPQWKCHFWKFQQWSISFYLQDRVDYCKDSLLGQRRLDMWRSSGSPALLGNVHRGEWNSHCHHRKVAPQHPFWMRINRKSINRTQHNDWTKYYLENKITTGQNGVGHNNSAMQFVKCTQRNSAVNNEQNTKSDNPWASRVYSSVSISKTSILFKLS